MILKAPYYDLRGFFYVTGQTGLMVPAASKPCARGAYCLLTRPILRVTARFSLGNVNDAG